jgi:CRP-like cAMP-binding protein
VARAAEKALGSDLRVRKVRKGELLIREGERAKEVFLIKEGTCAVEAAGADGRVVRIAERGAGEFVGEMGVRIEEDNREVADDASPRGGGGAGEGGAGYSPGGGGPKAPLGSTLAKVRSKWVGGRRGASVRAATDVVALAMNASQMRWILEHDYGADGEVGVAVEARQKELDRVTGGWKRGAS